MSELISTAPLYTKARVHLTKIGNILCTGKGCIGCDRKAQIGEQDFLEILGDVDLVDFNKQEPRFLSNSEGFPYNHEAKINRRHGNTTSTRAKSRKGKCRNKGVSLAAKEQHLITGNALKQTDFPSLKNKIKPGDSIVIYDGQDAKTRNHGASVKTSAQSKVKTQSKNKTVSFAAPPVRQGTFTLEEDTGKSGKSQEEKDVRKSKQINATLQCLHGRFHARSKTYPLLAEPKTNFLKMLQSSSVGIFDIKLMQDKKSSKWVEEALKSGAKEEELFPQIHNKINNGKNKKIKNTREESSARKIKRDKAKNFSNASLAPVDGSSSVFVIEHSHDKTSAKDESLHKLGFGAQWGQRTKSFPDVSILEIAESLDGVVQLGAIKLITQEYADRWCILVSSRIIRDYLVQSGVTLRGRRFELFDHTDAR